MSDTFNLSISLPGHASPITMSIAPIATFIAIEEFLRSNGHVDASITEVFVFREDLELPLNRTMRLMDYDIPNGDRIFVHPCRDVAVTIYFNGRELEHRFPPHFSVGSVSAWTIKELSLSSEHTKYVVELYHSSGHLSNSTRLYELSTNDCRLRLELVPRQLIINYKVDAVEQESDTRHRTVHDILSFAKFSPERFYLKHGTTSYKGKLDEVIRLREGEVFSAIPCGGGTVS